MNPEKPHEQAVCARCGTAIDLADCFRIRPVDGTGSAYLCRTEHIVAWVLRGASWQFDRPWEMSSDQRSASGRLILERIRAGESIEREFADTQALREWASAGGFWAAS